MDFFNFFSREGKSSKNIAKERLRLVLVHDRANVSPKFLEMMKSQLVDLISDYMEIEEDGMEIKLTKMKNDTDSTVPALVANIPIKKVKHLANI